MAGSIGIPCSDTARYSAFSDSLANLQKPPDTEVRFAVGNWRHRGREQLARWMMEADKDWLLMIDDDHVFAPNLLMRLLSHEKPVVAALCLRRDEPYTPFCFASEPSPGVYKAIDLAQHHGELLSVHAVGTGAMLIRREVFEALPQPWFTITADSGEDMLFCAAVRNAGFSIFCDLGMPIGHLTTAVVWPAITGDGWKVGFVISDETRILRDLPPAGAIEA